MNSSKSILITQSNYIPWKGYFDSMNSIDEFIVFDDMQYTKRDWRNRNQIKTPEGLRWLSIPVEVKGKFNQKINETLVADSAWGKEHWKTLVANYAKAPFFNAYKPIFEPLYFDDTLRNLSQINIQFIEAVNKILGIKTLILDSRDFSLSDGKTQRLVDLCIARGASQYCTGPAAKAYMDEALFKEAGITVKYFDYSNYPEYPQLFGEFQHAVTILDLLFNCGPTSINYMKSFSHAR